MTTQRTLIAISISLLLAACGSDSSDNQPGPTKPEPLKPEPTQYVNVDVGYANVTALRESVVINRVNGDQVLENVEVFKGLRFASASRFNHSELVPLDGDVDATKFGFVCPQLKTTIQTQSEDCLNLNLWRPNNTQAGDDLPVYVFLHGGDFEYGSGSDPLVHGDTVVAQGVDDDNPFIMVTLNYRLGILGSHWVKSDTTDGNYGIGDQKRALEWVQQYISDFGGNASNITLMGQGAGAMSIGLLQQQMLDGKLSADSFQRAIMQSNPYGFEYRSYKSAKNQVEDLELENASSEEVLSVQSDILSLPNRIVGWVLKSVNPLSSEATPMGELMPFSPYMACEKVGLTGCSKNAEQPYRSDFAVPTVVGSNSDDSNTMSMLPRLTFLIPKILESLQASQQDSLDSLSLSQVEQSVKEWVSDEANVEMIDSLMSGDDALVDIELPSLPSTAYEAVSQLFFGLSSSDITSQLLGFNDFAPHSESDLRLAMKNMSQFKMMMNDMLFSGPNRMKAMASLQPVTFYHFGYKPSFNVWTYNTNGENGDLDVEDALKTVSCISGACNGSELPFVFNKALKLDGSSVSPSKKDKALMATLSRLWFNDELFSRYQYDLGSDSVLVVDVNGDIGLELDWDRYSHAGDDPALSHGRLTGLEESGILNHYLLSN
ncbi:carboxylesterase family protein [Vibrio sp. SCSIO 43135]|uniref:carboxylesterase family protein n=1 Tax=Vibrio sp. SCSIO 43135 TaxID=2819096 RepID=UPI0020760145|nr:carboxylesterase family protein [Vibrio sp. SCSIO 43135]USD43341.1 carboxylesterase family protein [Vibrio sp. SCSIO 43135]